MQFGTMAEFEVAVKEQLAAGNISEAAQVILENPEAVAEYWVEWAFRVKMKSIHPGKELPTRPAGPMLKDGDLFGEPITTGRRLRKLPAFNYPS